MSFSSRKGVQHVNLRHMRLLLSHTFSAHLLNFWLCFCIFESWKHMKTMVLCGHINDNRKKSIYFTEGIGISKNVNAGPALPQNAIA